MIVTLSKWKNMLLSPQRVFPVRNCKEYEEIIGLYGFFKKMYRTLFIGLFSSSETYLTNEKLRNGNKNRVIFILRDYLSIIQSLVSLKCQRRGKVSKKNSFLLRWWDKAKTRTIRKIFVQYSFRYFWNLFQHKKIPKETISRNFFKTRKLLIRM